MILVKLIGIGNDESKRINNDDKDENDSIEKEGYKYNEDKCNNKDNDDDDSDNDDDWKIECIDVIVRMLKMIVKVIVLKIVYVGVLMRLVSITPGHVKLDWLPPPKILNDKEDKDNCD